MNGMTHPREDTPTDPPNLQVALAHAASGRPVFPCSAKTKHPAISKEAGGRGFLDATTDAKQIREWWSRYPSAIVGMPTGAKTGVWVLDVDVKPGQRGAESLALLTETFGPLPETLVCRTASGGRHFFFVHPRDGRRIPNKGSRLGIGHETWGDGAYPEVPFERAPNGQMVTPDLDVRGDGGYVILAGSIMLDGRAYEWASVDGAKAAPAPEWLAALVTVEPDAPRMAAVRGDASVPDGSFFAKVNAKALGNLQAWVPAVFPAAVPYHAGFRVSSKALGRALEEDISLVPEGIMDFGEELGKTPIDIVLEWGNAAKAADAAVWLCDRLGVDPAALGWRDRSARPSGRHEEVVPPAPPPEAGSTSEPPAGRPKLKVVGGTDHDPRPVVEIENGRLPQNTDDAAAYLMEGGAEVYQHGNRLVRVGRWEGASPGVERPTGSGVLLDISPEWLVDTMTRLVNFKRFDGRSGEWRKTDAPSKIAKTLLARAGEWPFDHLVGFCDSPTLTHDGRVVSEPGYDKPSGLYLSNPPKIRPIGKISPEDLAESSRALYSLFDTFPFATPADESAALAMAMTALLRRVLPAAPLGCISASTPGTGKSLFADCLSVLATGRTAPVAAIGKDTEELEKRIDSLLLKGDALTVFDNVDRAVKSDVLCQVTTQAHKSIRVLAQSRIVEAPTNVALYMTGNNLTLIGDLTRRAVLTNLDAGCERPELREFKRDAIAHVLKHRAEGIRNVLVIAKAYLDAGCPKVDAPPFGSFEQWDRMVRRPLMWAGWPDPLGPAGSMREQDHEFGGMVDLMVSWSEIQGKQEATAAELYELITARVPLMGGDYGPQYPALQDAAVTVLGAIGKWSPKELGYRLRQWSGRIVSGYRVVHGGKSKHGVKWRVESMTTASPA